MAKAPNRTSFKPGTSGNPNGRPKVPEDVKEARALTRNELDIQLNKFLRMSPEELMSARKNPGAMAIELLIVSVITNAINKGDQTRLGFLLERISSIGKVKERVEISNPYDDMPLEELKELVRKRIE